MADIISIADRPARMRPDARRPHRPADILFFTGVRYDHGGRVHEETANRKPLTTARSDKTFESA